MNIYIWIDSDSDTIIMLYVRGRHPMRVTLSQHLVEERWAEVAPPIKCGALRSGV